MSNINKEAKRIYDKKHYQENREKMLERSKEYRCLNRDRIRSHWKEYYQKNKNKLAKIAKKYYIENKEKILKKEKQYQKNNRKVLNEYNKRWYDKNKDHVRELARQHTKTEKGKACCQRYNTKRRARNRSIISTLTYKEWLDILKKSDYRCIYCGKKLIDSFDTTRDHIIPISKDGNNIQENVVPACRSCNSKKNNKILERRKMI